MGELHSCPKIISLGPQMHHQSIGSKEGVYNKAATDLLMNCARDRWLPADYHTTTDNGYN